MKKIDSRNLFEGIGYINPQFIEEAETPVKKRRNNIVWLKKVSAVAASFAVVVALLFTISAAFPAFAEELPLIGEVFRRLNSFGANAPTYEGMVQPIGEHAENDQYKAAVTEAYCDGEYLFFALRLEAKDAELLKMASLDTVESVDGTPGWSIEINGESGGLTYSLVSFTQKGDFFESDPVKIKLPHKTADGDTVHVSAAIGNLAGRTQEAIDKGEAGQIISTEPAIICFDLTTNTSYNQQKEATNASVDGLELKGYSCSPSKFSVTLAYPYFDTAGVYAEAWTVDGTELGEDTREFGDFGDGRYTFGDTAVQECSFIGPPDGTQKIVVAFYDDQPGIAGARAFGEFTIDLETGEVTPTTAYLEQGISHLSITEYADEKETEWANGKSQPIPSASPLPKNEKKNSMS